MADDYNDDSTADQLGDEITLSDLADLQSDTVTGNNAIPEVIDAFLQNKLSENYETELANFLAAFTRLEDGDVLGYDSSSGELTGISTIPSGVITMWSGDPDNIPSGWTLCDGSNGAPDLQNRFVVGAGDAYSQGETGGEDSVQLTLDELASHDHSDGSLSASNHDHGNGSLSASNHDHGSGSLDVSSHDHSDGDLSTTTQGDHDHGYDAVTTSTNSIGENIGGSSDLVLTQSASTTTDAGSHSHGVNGTTGSASPSVSGSTASSGANVTGNTSSTSPSVSGSTGTSGGDEAHENRPPFYSLAYIMKI